MCALPFTTGPPPKMAEIAGEITTTILILIELLSIIPLSHYILAFSLIFAALLYNFLEWHIAGDILRVFRGDKVRLTFNEASDIYHSVASKCRWLHSRYTVTPWLSTPHFQTAFLNFLGNPPVFQYRRQIFQVPDGGTIALDWLLASDVGECPSNAKEGISKEDTTPIVVVIPGLTSDSASSYLKHLVYKIAQEGWNVVVGNHRGLGGISITSDCFYNAGWTEDFRVVINHLHQEYPTTPLFAVGTSIGANVLVKYLGEEGENTPIAGAASVCSPWDLLVCDRFMTRKFLQRLYNRVLTIGLKGYAQLHRPVFTRLADWDGIKRSRSIRDFDNYATCLVAKYKTVDTFYRSCSSARFVANVSVPLLCISALDDPVCTSEAIPWDECRANKNIVLATTAHGGHLAFFQGITANKLWWVGAVDEFLRVLYASPHMHKKRKEAANGLHSSINHMEAGLFPDIGDDESIDNLVDLSRSQVTTTEQEVSHLEDRTSHHQPDRVETINKSYMKSIRELVAPVKKTMNQLSRRTSNSIWILAYIAIVTSWPFAGSVLSIILKNKFKNALPRAWPHNQ